MPLIPLIWAGSALLGVGALGTRVVLDGISDTTDRVTPNLLAIAGVGIGAAGLFIAIRKRK